MVSRSWAEEMKRLPESLLTPAEKAKVCYHVIVEETVAEKKLETAVEVLCDKTTLRFNNYSEEKTIASFFKLVISAASEVRTEGM